MAGSAAFVMAVNTKQTERKNKDYAETGGIVYTTVSSTLILSFFIIKLSLLISYLSTRNPDFIYSHRFFSECV
jgi:high-affinity nickel permease